MICRYCRVHDRVVPGRTDSAETVCPQHRRRNWEELRYREALVQALRRTPWVPPIGPGPVYEAIEAELERVQ